MQDLLRLETANGLGRPTDPAMLTRFGAYNQVPASSDTPKQDGDETDTSTDAE